MAGTIEDRLKAIAAGGAVAKAPSPIPNNPIIQAGYSNAMSRAKYAPNAGTIEARLQAIAQGKNEPSGFLGVAGKVMGAPVIKQALEAASVLDIPRRVVISAGKEYYDALSGKSSASFKDFYTQAKDPSFGFGKFVDSGNSWIDRAIGFAGDVAFDPTTYLTLGTSRAAGFGNKIAAAGKMIDEGGDALRAARLVKEGSWFLTPAERELAGLNQAGLYFGGVRIKGTGKLGQFGEAAFAKGRLLVSDRQFVQSIREAFSPLDASNARMALKRGVVPSSESAKAYIEVIRSSDAERAAMGQAGNLANAELNKSVIAGMDRNTIKSVAQNASDLLENPAAMANATDTERSFAMRARQFLDTLHGRVNDATKAISPDASVGYINNYFPHMMTPAAKEYAKGDSILQKVLRLTREDLGRPGFVEPRRLVADGKTKFFGTLLQEEDLTVKRLNEIARNGGFKGDFFEPNAIPVLEGYVRAHSKEMGRLARFSYLDSKGLLDRVVQQAVPNAQLIKQQSDRLGEVMKLASSANTKSKEAFTKFSSAVNDALTAIRNTDNATMSGVELSYRTAQDAVQAARGELNGAIADLEVFAESMRGMLFIDPNAGDENLVKMLLDEIDTTKTDLNNMIDAAMGSVEDSKQWLNDLSAQEGRVAELQSSLQVMDKRFNDLTEKVGRFGVLHDFFNANFDRILSGELTPESIPLVLQNADTLRGAVKEIQTVVGGGSKASLGEKSVKRGVKYGLQQKITESAWYKGITQIAPLNDSKILNMTGERRSEILAKTARGASTLHETESVGMNMILRNHDFFTTGLDGFWNPEMFIAGERIVMDDTVREQILRNIMPSELVAAEDELRAAMEVSAKHRRSMMADVSRGSASKTYNRKEVAERTLRTMYEQRDVVGTLESQVDELLAKKDARIRDWQAANGVTVKYNKKGQIIGVTKKGGGRITTPLTDELTSIDGEIRQLRNAIDEINSKVYTIGYGQDKTIKKFALNANEQLKPLTRGGKRLMRGAGDEGIGGLADLEAYAAGLDYRVEVMDISRSQKAAINRANNLSQGTRQVQRQLATATERYNIVSEVWRRSLALEDSLANMGFTLSDDHLRSITERVLNERGKVWQERSILIDGAQKQLRELRVALTTAQATGNYTPVEEMIQQVFNGKGRKNYLRDVAGTLDSFKVDSSITSVRKMWDDFNKSFTDWRSEINRAKPQSAFNTLERIKEVGGTDVASATESFVRATSATEMKRKYWEASDQMVFWYTSTVGGLDKGVDYKIVTKGQDKGLKILTKDGEAKVAKAVESMNAQVLPSERIIEIASQSLADEQRVVDGMSRLFKNVYPFEDGKFVAQSTTGQVALDPFVDPRAILAGEYNSTPLTVSRVFRTQADRIEQQLAVAERKAGIAEAVQGRFVRTEQRLGQRQTELRAAQTGAGLPADLWGRQDLPNVPQPRFSRTKAYATEIADQKTKIAGLKEKIKTAKTPQVKSRFERQLGEAKTKLAELEQLRLDARTQLPMTTNERAAVLRNASVGDFATTSEQGARSYLPRTVVDAQWKVNHELKALEQMPEMAQARASEAVYQKLDELVGREMGNVSVKDRVIALIRDSGIDAGTDRFGVKIADQLAADERLAALGFSEGEWNSLFSSDVSIQTRGKLNKKIKQLEDLAVEADKKAENALNNSVKSRFRNQAKIYRDEIARTVSLREAADPAVRDAAKLKFSELEKYIEELSAKVNIPADTIRRAVYGGTYVDGAAAELRRESLKNAWQVTSDYGLLKHRSDLLDSVPMQLQRNLKEEIGFLQERLGRLRGDIGGTGPYSVIGSQTAYEDAIWAARGEASRARRLSEDISGVAGIPVGKPANTKPFVPTPSALGITERQLEKSGPTQLQKVADNLRVAAKRGIDVSNREYKRGMRGVQLSPYASSKSLAMFSELEKLTAERAATQVALGDAKATLERLTPMADTVRNAKLKDWEPAIQGINAILHGTVDKNGKTARKGLYRQLEDAQARIAGRLDSIGSKQEALARRVAEADVVYGNASLAASHAEQSLKAIDGMLSERIVAINDVLESKPKIAGKFDEGARTELSAWSKRAMEIVDRLKADPSNKAMALLAEAHIADFQTRAFDQMVVSEKALLEKVKAGFGSTESVALLNEGWVRLGGYSDEELKNLKRMRKGLKGADKKPYRAANVVNLGMPGLQVPKEVADAFENISKSLSVPAGVAKATEFVSKYTQFFKAYATATPGFHVRNAMSDYFQMLAGGGNPINFMEALPHVKQYVEDPAGWLKNIPQAQRGMAEKAMRSALASGGGHFTDALDEFMLRGDTWIYNNKWLNMMERTGHKQDFVRRYMFAYDQIKKGLDVDMATANTRKFLIDYMNPSAADQAIRNIVPFWTFMSRNLPNQLVNRWTNPRAYAIYNSFVRNMDSSTENDIIPSYMKENGAFKVGGMWVQPDLPFTRVNQQLSEIAQPNRLLSYVNPLLRLPIELAGGTKLYNNQPFSDKPQDMSLGSKLASPLLGLMGQLQQDATGAYKTTDKANYAIQNLIPPLATAERLFPSTDTYAQKRGSNIASFFGIPVRNVPASAVDTEANKRKKAMEKYMAQQKALGFVK